VSNSLIKSSILWHKYFKKIKLYVHWGMVAGVAMFRRANTRIEKNCKDAKKLRDMKKPRVLELGKLGK